MADKAEQEVYVALLDFATNTADGQPIVVTRGQRVRGGDLTRRFSGFFIEASADDLEIAEARAAVDALNY
jgi:hypothetical protein